MHASTSPPGQEMARASFTLHTNGFGGLGDVTLTWGSLFLPKSGSESNWGPGKTSYSVGESLPGLEATAWLDYSLCLSRVPCESGLVQLFIEDTARCVFDAQGSTGIDQAQEKRSYRDGG